MWRKGSLYGKQKCPTQKKFKEDTEEFRNIKQGKSGKTPPDGGREQKTLVNIEDASCSLMVGVRTKEWDDLPSPGLMLL